MIRINAKVKSAPTKPRRTADEDRPLSEVFFTWTDDEKDAFIQQQIAESAAAYGPASASDELKPARGRGRPRVGKGSKQIALSIELGLLKRVDAFAKRHKLTRARAVALLLGGFLSELDERRKRRDAPAR